MSYKLLFSPGSCASVVQLCLEKSGAKYELVDKPKTPEELEKISPMKQIPVLWLPDGTSITESVAMILKLDDDLPGLLPPRDSPHRAQAYRWLLFSTINSHETVGRWYYAHRFTTDKEGVPAVKEAALERLNTLFHIIEKNAFENGSEFVAGTKEPTAVDYHVLMTIEWLGWTGTAEKVLEDCPKLRKLKEVLHKDETVRKVWKQHNFIKE